MMRAAALVWLAACLCLGSCAVPMLEVEREPAKAQVFLDGQQLPDAGPIHLRYYGTTQLSGREAISVREGPRRRDRSVDVELPEPFSPWFFPFDFVLEACTYPFATARYQNRVRLALPERPELVDGISPRDLPAIRLRAEQALEER